MEASTARKLFRQNSLAGSSGVGKIAGRDLMIAGMPIHAVPLQSWTVTR
jgi:hypothetical protein